MRCSKLAAALLVAVMLAGSSSRVVGADEKSPDAAKPAAVEKESKKAKSVRLTKPWKQISSLSDEQKTKIADLHKKALEEKKAVEQREHEAIMALLNDDQKAEVSAMMEKETSQRKMKTKKGDDAEDGASSEKAG